MTSIQLLAGIVDICIVVLTFVIAARRHPRRSALPLAIPYSNCPSCGRGKTPGRICLNCGYRGQVLRFRNSSLLLPLDIVWRDAKGCAGPGAHQPQDPRGSWLTL